MYCLFLTHRFKREKAYKMESETHSDIPVHIKIRYNIKRKVETSINKIPFGFTMTKKNQKRINFTMIVLSNTKITLKLSENENFPLATAYIV